LWFGSFAGLVRFDGVRFTVFNSSNTPELPSSGIVNLHLDSLNRLWISTLNGLVVSEPNRWTVLHRKKEWTGDYARSFSEHAGVICITSFDGKVFCARGDEMRELTEPPGQKDFGYFGYVDRRGNIWAAQSHFFGRWNGTSWECSELAGSITNQFEVAAPGRDGSLLVFSGGKVLRIDDEEIRSQIEPENNSRMHNIWRMDEASDGTIWLGTSHNGLFGVSPQGAVRRYTTANGLTYDSIRFSFEDREGNLWIGSSGGGLLRFKRRTFMNYDLEHGLPERVVKALIEESPSRVLIGTYGKGVARFENNRITPVIENNGTDFRPYVQCLLRDREGKLWLGLFNDGVQIKTDRSYRSVPPSLAGGKNVSALFEDSQGKIWIGGSETISVYTDGQFTPFPGEERLKGVRCFAENSSDHSIWGGTE